MFHHDTKNFSEGDKEWKLPHMSRPQKSNIVQVSAFQHCKSPMTYGPRKKKPPNYKALKSEEKVDQYRNIYTDA